MIENRDLVVLDNRLLLTLCPLELVEKKLLYILISRIKPDMLIKPSKEDLCNPTISDKAFIRTKFIGDSAEDWYKISCKEYADLCGISIGNARTVILKTLRTLRSKSIKLKDGEDFIEYSWLSGIAYNKETDTIAVKWNSDILPYITHLSKYFTQIPLQVILGMTSTYTWKLYEILRCYKSINMKEPKIVLTVEELLNLLDVTPGWREYRYFKIKILTVAVKYMREHKLFPQLAFKEIRSGRKVGSIEFSNLARKDNVILQKEMSDKEYDAFLYKLNQESFKEVDYIGVMI